MTATGESFSHAAALSRLSDGQLVALLGARPDLASPPPRDMAALAARASSWQSIHLCSSNLNQASHQVVEALCLLPVPATVADLATVLGDGTRPEELEPVVAHLADLALVVRSGGTVLLHPQLTGLLHPANLGPPAATLLGPEPASAVHALARHIGIDAGRTKGDAIAAVSRALREPDRITRLVQQGPDGTAELTRRLAERYPVGTVAHGIHNLRGDSPLRWMIKVGLVVATEWDTVVMPGEVGLALRGGRPFPDFSPRPPAIGWTPLDADAVDQAGCEQALRLVAELATILDSWQENPPKLLKAGGVGVRDVRRAAATTGRTETEAARLIELAAVAGLAGWDMVAGHALPRPAYDSWLDLDAAQRWGVLAEAWLASEVQLNLAGSLGTNEKATPPLQHRGSEQVARRRRQLVLTVLAEGGTGQVADRATLVARVQWDAPGVWSGGPAEAPLLASWVLEEAAMLGMVAHGALSPIGQLMVGGQSTEAVTRLAGRAAPVISEFVIQADLTVVATGQLPAPVKSQLELMADLESSGAATVYRLSEPSLRRAFDAGYTVPEIIGFLAGHATKGVPQPLSYLVEDMGRRHGRLRLGPASCYLRSEDPVVLAEILVARRAAKLELQQIAPTVLVSPAGPAAVIEVLRAGGYLPAMEDSTGALVVTRPAARRAPDGRQVVKAGGLGPGRLRPGDGTRPDLAALVRRLRSTGLPPAPGRQTALALRGPEPARRDSTEPAGIGVSFPHPPDRPSQIARTPAAIDQVLAMACQEDWSVRVEYVSQKGLVEQFNAAIVGIDGSHVSVGVLPAFHPKMLAVGRIRWVRVLTEAEEELA